MTIPKIYNIFQYLRDYNNKRNPFKRSIKEYEWNLKIEELPDHPLVKIGLFSENEGQLTGNDFILKVQRPTFTNAPPPPKILNNWLQRGWERADGVVAAIQAQNVNDNDGKMVIINSTPTNII